MATYQRPVTVNYGPQGSGLEGTLGVTVTSSDGGTTHVARTTTGIEELVAGSGAYRALVTLDPSWGFVVVTFDATGFPVAPQVVNAGDYALTPGGGGGSSSIVATYDPSLPTRKDEVRQRVGDISPLPQWFLDDRTILAYLGKYSFAETCARCAEAIGAQCIQLANSVQQKNLKLDYGNRAKAAYELADRFRNLADPEPDDPKRYGAGAAQMLGPDLSNYSSSLGLPVGDPNLKP